MKKHLTLIACAGTLLLGAQTNLVAQPAPVATPAPPTTPQPAVAELAEQVYSIASGFGGGASASPGQTLVIPKEGADAKALADIEEDLTVMARILEKAAGRDEKGRHAMGITVYGGFSSSAAPRNLYIEGHGAIFFLNVNFPLVAPPTKPEAEPKESTSTEWEEARRELHHSGSDFNFQWSTPGTMTLGGSGPAEEFDADKVEDLKKDLIAALKNAAHIRKLKSDETVTVVVTGRGARGDGKPSRTRPRAASGAVSGTTLAWAAARSGADGRGTKLILRARKSDIDAFQKDKTSLDDFRKKVTTISY